MDESGENGQVIECPGHGPMRRITRMGVLIDIRCETCWNRPIDLVERAHFGSQGGSDVTP